MAKLDFPDTPAVGEVYGSSGTRWQWDGSRWGSTSGVAGPRGAVAYAQITGNIAGYAGSVIDVYGLSVTFSVIAGRTYKVTGEIFSATTVAGDLAQLFITTGAGAAQQSSNWPLPSAANSHKGHVEYVFTAASTTTTTLKLMYARGVGTGTHTVIAVPSAPAFILVEDITYEAGSSAGGFDALPKGLLAYLTSSDVAVTVVAPTFVMLRSTSVPLVAGRNYCVVSGGIGSYITAGTQGSTFNMSVFLDGTNYGGRLIVDTLLSGGYIPQPTFEWRFKAPTTKTTVVELRAQRQTASAGTMQARYDMAVLDEGAAS